MGQDGALRDMLIRDEVTQLVHRYGACLDARDVEGVVACFTPDAHVELSGGVTVLDGEAALRAHWTRSLALGPASTHLISNVIVEVVDETHVRVASQAVAFVVRGSHVVTRGLRYRDDGVRTAPGWRLRHRSHRAEWQYEVPAAEIRSPALPVEGGGAGPR